MLIGPKLPNGLERIPGMGSDIGFMVRLGHGPHSSSRSDGQRRRRVGVGEIGRILGACCPNLFGWRWRAAVSAAACSTAQNPWNFVRSSDNPGRCSGIPALRSIWATCPRLLHRGGGRAARKERWKLWRLSKIPSDSCWRELFPPGWKPGSTAGGTPAATYSKKLAQRGGELSQY